MRNLLTDPAWQPEDLGAPLPDSPHAVSVAMPTWQDVVDYEEGTPRVVNALRCGYPRFFVHPKVQELCKAAERCRDFVEARTAGKGRVDAFGEAFAVTMPQDCYKTARLYWRYCGETVSSRMAEYLLSGARDEANTGRLSPCPRCVCLVTTADTAPQTRVWPKTASRWR